MGKPIKTGVNNFKYGDEVFVYVEYEGIVEGIIKGINDDINPFLYLIESKSTSERYQVSQLHTFKTFRDANAFINYCVRDEVINLCDKLHIDISSYRVRMNSFLKQPKFTKAFIDAYLGSFVDIKLDNGELLSGILTYCRYYKANDGIVSENFYYVKNPNTNCFTTFKISDIEKIKTKEK